MSGRYHYAAHGLRIVCDLPLPLPRVPASDAPADLDMALGRVPPGERCGAGHRRRRITDQMRYEIVGGRRAVIELLPAAREADVSDLIVSRLLTVAIYQQNRLPLHASAVETAGGVVAVCGPTGAGKSTLAAMLAVAGGRVLADDMVVPGGAELDTVWPATDGMKLTPGSLACVGADTAGLPAANSVEGKLRRPLPDAGAAPGRLGCLVALGEGPARLTRLSPLEAIAAWSRCVKMPELVDEAPEPAAVWRRWMRLAGRVPVYRAGRGASLDELTMLAALLHHDVPASAPALIGEARA